jgi:(p)ppGpp synthase/HD superfamily hydrolase
MDIVTHAKMFANGAHAAIGQKRKYSGEDYIVHPAEVVDILISHGIEKPEMLAGAMLHDVVEDTGVSLDLVHRVFGNVVAALVEGLTDVSKKEDGNRKTRKAIDRLHTENASIEARIIKMADCISNTRDIVKHDICFAKVYLSEIEQLMDKAFVDVHDGLYATLRGFLDEGWRTVNKPD